MSVSLLSTEDQQFTVLLDEVSATLSYIGQARPRSATSAAVWRIKRLNTSSGVQLLFADGDTFFDNVWDNRASLTYV